jgi:hypothetical protein
MANKFKPLRVRQNGDIVITLSIEAITHTLRMLITDDNGDPEYRVIDAVKFAKDVAMELRREEEDGTTLVSEMLDAAVERAVENGAEGIKEIKRAKR